jgi:hypothetical protein
VQEQNSPGNGPETVPETVPRQHERSCIPHRAPHCAHCQSVQQASVSSVHVHALCVLKISKGQQYTSATALSVTTTVYHLLLLIVLVLLKHTHTVLMYDNVYRYYHIALLSKAT